MCANHPLTILSFLVEDKEGVLDDLIATLQTGDAFKR